jgi:hypothetical protein
LVRRLISGADLRSALSSEELERRSQWLPEKLAQKLRGLEKQIPPSFRPDHAQATPDGADHWMTLVPKDYLERRAWEIYAVSRICNALGARSQFSRTVRGATCA